MQQALDYIHVKNSFAHKDTKVFFKPGRNYIIGNYGSGKSELIEMIGFSFFGSCALRGKASTYPKLEVELCFNHYGESFKIIRKVSDASLYLLDKETSVYVEIATSTSGVNSKIISLLGYDYTIYLLSNYCQQGKLQYFSDLLPSKRLQFIDKVSGIEEAKELVDWLQSQRKTLKASLETLKFMLTEPTHSEGLDLSRDYQSELDTLFFDNTCINELNNRITELSKKGFKPIPKEVKPLPKDKEVLLALSEEEIESIQELYKYYSFLEKDLNNLENQLKQLPKKPLKLRDIEVEISEIEQVLTQKALNSLEDVNITCPSCNHSFGTESLKDSSHGLIHYTTRELNDYIIWKDPSNQEKIVSLNQEIKKLEKEYNALDKQEVLPGYPLSSLNITIFLRDIKEAQASEEKYSSYLQEREEALIANEETNKQIEELKGQLQDYLEDQTKISNLRAELTAKQSEKDFYFKQYELYQEALSRYEGVNREYELIVDLIKQISSITKEIKQSTIPLINYHASSYLNMMTRGVMSSIEITENYDLIVDGHSIALRSGAQKDLASLAFRLSLGKSIILGMLPLFIGDEIDASSPTDVSSDITSALEEMSEQGFQILLITHKDKSTLENCHIIDLG